MEKGWLDTETSPKQHIDLGEARLFSRGKKSKWLTNCPKNRNKSEV